MIVTDPKCGKSWSGLRAQHCTACHETFSGTSAGDQHRVGPYHNRFCRPPATVGLVFNVEREVWYTPGSDEDRARLAAWRALQ